MKRFLCSLLFIPLSLTSLKPALPPDPPVRIIEAPNPDALDVWIDKLFIAECDGCEPTFSKIDDDGLRVYSLGQWKLPTFKQYYEKYMLSDGEHLSTSTAKELVYNVPIQRELIRKIITNEPQQWRLWYNSVKTKVGLPPTI